jgi:hypothetical protein
MNKTAFMNKKKTQRFYYQQPLSDFNVEHYQNFKLETKMNKVVILLEIQTRLFQNDSLLQN